MKRILFFLAAVAATAGCASERPPLTEPELVANVDARLVHAYTGFGLGLFRQIVQKEPTTNVFLSPASIAFALSMTYQGASGETQEAMARTLELHGMTPGDVAQAAAAWRAALANPDRKVELSIANSLWARQGIPFRQEFLDIARRGYGAEVATLDFNQPAASRTINDWVSRNTRQRIRQIVPDRLDPDDVLYLINAIYFNGSWTHAFDRRATHAGEFRLPGGQRAQVQMMSRDGQYAVLEGAGFRAIRLPYGSGRMSMYIFLPDERSDLASLYRQLDGRSWEQWMGGFRQQRVYLRMPRFQLEYEKTLNEVLQQMGMQLAFDPGRARFEGMLPTEFLARQNAYISKVKHKTFVVVNEEGTEAAGATVVGVGVTSMPPEFTVDRPFMMAIRDDATGTVLFMGQISDPR